MYRNIYDLRLQLFNPIKKTMAETFPEKLVEAVRRFPCLWDNSSPTFKDKIAKENAWKAVAAEVNFKVMILSEIRGWQKMDSDLAFFVLFCFYYI